MSRRFGLSSATALVLVLVLASETFAAGEAPVLRRVATEQKVIALTLDDCYSRSRGEAILQTLLAYNVRVTLFCTSIYLPKYKDLWFRYLQAGNEFGNHSKTHPKLTTLTREEIRNQICGARVQIETALGVPSTNFFRPPYGAHNETVRQVAKSCGYTHTVLWNVTTADTSKASTEDRIVARALAAIPGSIILAHIGPSKTPGALPRIIEGFLERGFRFVTLTELLASAG